MGGLYRKGPLFFYHYCSILLGKLTKSDFMSRVRSNIAQKHLPLENHIWSLLAPIHTKNWSKVKLDQVGVDLNNVQNHSPVFKEILSGYVPHL